MKEKSYVARPGTLALVLTLMTTCLTKGTLAKSVTEVEGTATATVAAWNFEAAGNGTEFTGIDIGRTAYEGDTIKDTVLAPGTKESFGIVLDGSGSEVGIDYSVTITAVSDVDLPDDLIFNVGDTTYDLGGDITGTISYADGVDAMKKTTTVNWEWDYGFDDTAARNDNDYAGKSWMLNIKATGTQVELTFTAAQPPPPPCAGGKVS